MEKIRFDEMLNNLNNLIREKALENRIIILFGHCGASLDLIDVLEEKGLKVSYILDNSSEKHGIVYKGAKVVPANDVMSLLKAGDRGEASIVLITSRFYESMASQLRNLGYDGRIEKLINYNTYADYSTSEATKTKMFAREQSGEQLLEQVREKHKKHFVVYLPFVALGDTYLALAYWPAYARKRGIEKVVFCVASGVQKQIVEMFGNYPVEVFEQAKLDSMIQASIYNKEENAFVAHHDRPYVVNLHKALYVKKIHLEKIFCCGVYGLLENTIPAKPTFQKEFENLNDIPKGEAVIFSPYAKSVPTLDPKFWDKAVEYYKSIGKKCYTNVVGDEVPLKGTEPICPTIAEMSSVVERAGIFVGIRSGLCDIIKDAKAKKIAIYPDYNYCDTKWKAIEIYWLEQFNYNLLATEEIKWDEI